MAIKSRIIPIAGPNIRWHVFLKDTLNIIGRNLTRNLDVSGLKLNDYAKFISALGEFQDAEITPIDTLKNNKAILHHLHFSFLIVGSSELILKINETTTLNTISTKIKGGRIALVSGDLAGWRCLTIGLCEDPKDYELGKSLLNSFFQLGLQHIFANYSRQQ